MTPTELIIDATPCVDNNYLIDLFRCHAHSPGALLFDNAGDITPASRFSIMLWQPSELIALKGHAELIWRNNQYEMVANVDDPFVRIEQALQQLEQQTNYAAAASFPDLPFIIGAAGQIGYDAGRVLEKLPEIACDDYENPDVVVGIYTHSLILDHVSQTLYQCRLSTEPDYFDTFGQDQRRREQQKQEAFRLTTPWQSNLAENEYLAALRKIDDYLHAGDCYQVNMAQRFHANYAGDEFLAYLRLREANRAPFSAFMKTPSSYILSISPERFLSVSDGFVETKPIKGTRPRFEDPVLDRQSAQSLLDATKDRAENLMIVDLLRNDLSKHCLPGSITVPKLFALESYAAVHHMVSTIHGQLPPETSPLRLLSGGFPGGSITGAPKIRAMEIIEELEPQRRNIYCGSIFYCGMRNDLDSSICIRTLLAENQTMYCWAGGGIVADSVAELEYQETFDKVAKILPVLADNE